MFPSLSDAGLTRLAGREPDKEWGNELVRVLTQQNTRLIQAIQALLFNCTQDLEHRGDVNLFDLTVNNLTVNHITVEEDITINNSGGGAGPMRLATATAMWTNVAGTGKTSYVACTDNETGDVVNVYLLRTAQQDPNVREGDVIGYERDYAGDAICVTDCLDAKIGASMNWVGDIAAIPPGWRLYTKAGARNLSGYTGDGSGNGQYGSIGGTGGNTEHKHDPHDAGEIADHIGSTDLNANEQTSAEGVIVSVSWEANQTECASAGVLLNNAVASVIPNPHNHTLNPVNCVLYAGSGTPVSVASADPPFTGDKSLTVTGTDTLSEVICFCEASTHGHCHNILPHSHAAAGLPHTHVVYAHRHPLPTMEHSGTLQHSLAQHLDPFVVVGVIERFE